MARQLRNLTKTITKPALSSPPSSYKFMDRLFSLTSSPSSSGVVRSSAPDVADVAGEDDLSSTVKSVLLPDILQPRVVVYDGVCHLCHRGVKWVIEADKDRKIKFCCLQSKAAEPYLSVSGLDREDVLLRLLFVEGPGLYHQASTAALRVASYLPLPYSALSSLLIVPIPIRDAVYDYVAKHRYDWFGKSTDCLVLQEKELLERFIDRDEMMDSS